MGTGEEEVRGNIRYRGVNVTFDLAPGVVDVGTSGGTLCTQSTACAGGMQSVRQNTHLPAPAGVGVAALHLRSRTALRVPPLRCYA